jgi:hypothetical protein
MIVRRAIYAGQHYFGDAGRLRASVEAWTEDATQTMVPGNVLGLIVPHGSAVEFGPVAGHAYKMLYTTPQRFDSVTMIAPQLRPSQHAWVCEAADAYETPLDLTRVDHDLRKRMRIETDADADEQIETQMPFVHLALGDVPVLPLRVSETASADALKPHLGALGLLIIVANLPAGEEQLTCDLIERFELTRASVGGASGKGRFFGLGRQDKLRAWSADLAALSIGLDLLRAQGAHAARLLKTEGIHAAWVVYRV